MKRSCLNLREDLPETRTLLITNIKNEHDLILIKEKLNLYGDIKETYTIQDNNSILFVIFYDIRDAKTAKKELDGLTVGESKIYTFFTISKYEIPKEGDLCDETRNQGTLLLISRNLDSPLTNEEIIELFSIFGDIKEIREYRTFQKFIEYYDTRNTINAFEEFGERQYKTGVLMLRYLWDTTKKARWDLIRNTDVILESIKNGSFMESNESLRIDKIVYARAMDDFIAENVDLISEFDF